MHLVKNIKIFFSNPIKIEAGETWASSSLLTMQLDDIISAKYPEMSSLFRVEINSVFRCQTNKVCVKVKNKIIKL